jgi:hypothetical protein
MDAVLKPSPFKRLMRVFNKSLFEVKFRMVSINLSAKLTCGTDGDGEDCLNSGEVAVFLFRLTPFLILECIFCFLVFLIYKKMDVISNFRSILSNHHEKVGLEVIQELLPTTPAMILPPRSSVLYSRKPEPEPYELYTIERTDKDFVIPPTVTKEGRIVSDKGSTKIIESKDLYTN